MNEPASKQPKAPLILAVDDEARNLQVLGNLLREKKYNISFARNGQQALESVMANLPDLILMDVMMPEMDGYEACRRIKKMPTAATIPIIFLTARTETADVVEGFRAGGVDYVTKPFRAEELMARVETHIQLHQLKSLLPICSYCKKIRNDSDYWQNVDDYIQQHTGTQFTHGICPTCYTRLLSDMGVDAAEDKQ